jgi:hypothetical protein
MFLAYTIGVFIGSLYLVSQLVGTGLPQIVALCVMLFSVLPGVIAFLGSFEEMWENG